MTAPTEPTPTTPGVVGEAHVIEGPDVASGTVTVSLNSEEQGVGLIEEAMGRARVRDMYVNMGSRIGMVIVLAVIFLGLNWMVLWFLRDAFTADIRMLEAKPPTITAADRLITPHVLMTLIAATVVEVGISIRAVVAYLFPKNGK